MREWPVDRCPPPCDERFEWFVARGAFACRGAVVARGALALRGGFVAREEFAECGAGERGATARGEDARGSIARGAGERGVTARGEYDGERGVTARDDSRELAPFRGPMLAREAGPLGERSGECDQPSRASIGEASRRFHPSRAVAFIEGAFARVQPSRGADANTRDRFPEPPLPFPLPPPRPPVP
ncbi:MAG TPA: hypothetical protein VM052_09190 [Candidatus Limnocylindrales bacterium]|nr:hypothetical protein [Candidatus Limnocylindrales bacterium]